MVSELNQMNLNEMHLVEWLKQIKDLWELSFEQLARISHVEEKVLLRYLALGPSEIKELPTVPAELDAAMPLVGLYRQVVKVYPTAELQNEWLKRPNTVFEGNRPIDVMAMSAEHLAYVCYAVESGLRLA